MKKLSIFLLISMLGIAFYSCKEQTYAKQLKQEEKLIKSFINAHKGEYEELESGMYYKLLKAGNTDGESILPGNTAIVRFISITLSAPPDTIKNWTTVDFSQPPTFRYDGLGIYSVACEAWITAISKMKYRNSEAEIIAPSKTGFNSYTHGYALEYWGVSDDGQTVTPRRYHLKLNFENK